jgi:hypothetical protein
MTNPGVDPAETAITDPFAVTQAAVLELEPFVKSVPIDILKADTPYPVSSDFARHMGVQGVIAFNASYVKLSEELSREDLMVAARHAVAISDTDRFDELSEDVQRRAIFAKGFTLSMLSGDERYAVLDQPL